MERYHDSLLLFLTLSIWAVGIIALVVIIRRSRQPAPQQPSQPTSQPPTIGPLLARATSQRQPSGRPGQLYPGEPPSRVVAACPTVDSPAGRVPLQEWLIHLRGTGVRTEVVTTFYARAAANPQVAAYFTGVDMGQLQRHFLRALTIIADHGVTVGLVRNLHERHARIRNHRGEPITDEIWDAVVDVLVDVLATEQGIPPRTLVALATALVPIRSAVVGGDHVTPAG